MRQLANPNPNPYPNVLAGILLRASWLIGAMVQVGGASHIDNILALTSAADALVALLPSSNDAVVESAAYALGSIAEGGDAALDLCESGTAAVAALLQLLEHPRAGVAEQAARCLRCLAASSFTRQRVICEQGAVTALAGLLAHASAGVVLQATGALVALLRRNKKQVRGMRIVANFARSANKIVRAELKSQMVDGFDSIGRSG